MYSIDIIKTDETIVDYCKKNRYSKGTYKNIAYGFSIYCNAIGMTPTELFEEAVIEQTKPIQLRKINKHLAKLQEAIIDLAPQTQGQLMSTVTNFYRRNDIQVPYMRPIKAKSLKENFYIPVKEDIRRSILNTNPRNQAIILTQATSGMGMSEVLSLTVDQFDDGVDKNDIVTWHITRAKTDYDYITFSSPEATRAIRLHLEDYDGTSLWGIDKTGLLSMYKRLDERVGSDVPKGNYAKIRSHNLRKYFNDTLRDAGAPLYLVDYLSGRKESETHAAYHTWKPEKLKEEYIKYLPALAIMEEVRVVSNDDVMSELQRQHDDNLQMSMKMTELEAELFEMKKLVAASNLYQYGSESVKKKIEKKMGEM